MKRLSISSLALAAALVSAFALDSSNTRRRVGPLPEGILVTTGQEIRPEGAVTPIPGRPVDLALSKDGSLLFAKDNKGLVILGTKPGAMPIMVREPGMGASMHGIFAGDSGRAYWTTSGNDLVITDPKRDPPVSRRIRLPGPKGKGASYPCGVALLAKETRALVCLSRNNTLAVVDLAAGKPIREIPVGVAPYDVVVSPDGRKAFVSNWGGRRAKPGDRIAYSSGTPVVVDRRGVASSGTISEVDLRRGKAIREVEVGLHPSDLALSRDGRRLYVANSNSDTVSILATRPLRVVETLRVSPLGGREFGSAPTGLALSADERRIYVALGGNNVVAVFDTEWPKGTIWVRPPHGPPDRMSDLIRTGWYPGAIAIGNGRLYVANVKGTGSRDRGNAAGFNSHQHLGSVQSVSLAPRSKPRTHDRGSYRELMDWRMGFEPFPPHPVLGDFENPSPLRHVVYIVKENRTYDQVFGDMGRGESDPKLCIFGREVTPNHHALADQFVLLDNFYCNGVLSADGHSWVTEGYVTDHLEKAFGGFSRSYTFGDDALTYSSSGFLWDDLIDRGLWVRNYGEFDYAEPIPKTSTWTDIYRDWKSGARRIRFKRSIGVARLANRSNRSYPGWNMRIPDVLRADVFLRELRRFEREKRFPSLAIVYLPSDHTSGTQPGAPTPRAQVADNDLALGRVVEGLTKSPFWKRMAIFVVEDDPQDGFDHVDGHRSPCLVLSPWSRQGGRVVSSFYNQTSVVRTIRRILGFPELNQMDGASSLMADCFAGRQDLTPYRCLPNSVPLDEMNPPAKSLSGMARHWAERSRELPLDRVDASDEDTLNRILWHAAKGPNAPYPKHLAGAHGSGRRAMTTAD